MPMRTLRLVNIAASAEGLRLRRMIARIKSQAIYGVIAIVFLLAAFFGLHVVGFFALQMIPLSPLYSALIVFGVDLVFGLILGILASRSSTDRIEMEAKQVSHQARQQLAIAAATAGTFAPIARLAGLKYVSGLAIGALTARYLAQSNPTPPTPRRR